MPKTHEVYPICMQQYGSSRKRIIIIPHRTKDIKEGVNMVRKIMAAFYESIHQESLHHLPTVHGLRVSELIELILQAIQSAGYVYNQECFLGIDFDNVSQKDTYCIDERLEAASKSDMCNYVAQMCHVYNPLCIFNPFYEKDVDAYEQLEYACGESTLIGKNRSPSIYKAIIEIALIDEETDITHEKQVRDILHNKKIKYYVQCTSKSEEHISKIVKDLEPDFIERHLI